METAQLSYFILACQFRNHAAAAACSQISASALSENIDALERELGIALFQRGPHGHYPTEAARWLYQRVEPLLQTIEAADVLFSTPQPISIQFLEITSPLQFMAGHLARATSLAIRDLMRSMPGVVAHARFALSRPPYMHVLEDFAGSDRFFGDQKRSQVVLDYAQDPNETDGVVILKDEWLSLAGMGVSKQGLDRPLLFDDLRKAVLYLPPLGTAQLAQVREYCRTHDLPDPIVIEEDVGTFERLSREHQPFHLLAPRSLVAMSAARSNLSPQQLPVALDTKIVAKYASNDELAAAYVEHLRSIIQIENLVVFFRPKITTKQLRYFLAVAEQLNVTATARQLHVAQPALSNQLRKLETSLGTPLFERNRTGLAPHDSASLLANFIRPAMVALDGIASAAAHYAASRQERLTIGLMPTAADDGPLARAIASALEEWSRQYPAAKLRILEGSTETLKRWVDAGDIGFALVEAQVSRSWQVDLQAEDFLGIVSNAQRALLGVGDIGLRDALKLPLVLPSQAFGLRQIVDTAASDIGIQVSPQMEVNALPVLLAVIRKMRLATILPSSAVKAFADRDALQFNRIRNPTLTRRLSILFSPDRTLTNVERDLIGLLRQHLASAFPNPV